MTRARRLMLLALLASLGLLLAGCGGTTFLISRDQEIEIGEDAAAEFDSEHEVDRSSDLAQWLQDIGRRVGEAASPPDYPYSFTLVREDVNNAFALPGGPIYFYEGLIDTLDRDEDQVAWVIGHEITHIRQQHAVRRIERQIGASLLIDMLLGKDTARDIAGLVGGLMLQDYGRDHEHMADRLGCRWAAGAGYDPTAAIPVLETFRELQGEDPSDLEILAMSHPGSSDRIESVQRYLDRQGYSGEYYP
ncbi:MAG: M48 family metalloprotease [Armatimonadota bacterium]|nr:M48 family metalloprotease [Armatimonadota bacterium]